MTLMLPVFLGGALTISSEPCILPMLPFVFARAEQSFVRDGLPMLWRRYRRLCTSTVREQRLYQLIRQSKDVREYAFAVPFLDDSEGIWIHFQLGDCHETTGI